MNPLRTRLIRLAATLPKGRDKTALLSLLAGHRSWGGTLAQIRDRFTDEMRGLVAVITLDDPSDALDGFEKLKDAAEDFKTWGLKGARVDDPEEIEDLETAIEDFIDGVQNGLDIAQGHIDEGHDAGRRVQNDIEEAVGDLEKTLDQLDRARY